MLKRFIEKQALKYIRKLITQGGHKQRITAFFKVFVDEMNNEYCEENYISTETFILVCLCENFKSIDYDDEKIELTIVK